MSNDTAQRSATATVLVTASALQDANRAFISSGSLT